MARYCGDRSSEHLIKNAQQFKENCLLKGKSLLTDELIWTEEYCNELIVHYVENIDKGSGDFFEKLKAQLAEASPSAKVLAAEMLWLMLLCPSNTGPVSKRNSIERVFSWSGKQLSLIKREDFLSDGALTGVGSAGTAYNTLRWRELVYLIRFTEAFLKLDLKQREELLSEHQGFSIWLESLPENESRQLRHMILFLFFPDYHERIFGNTDRRAILLKLTDITSAKYSRMKCSEIDDQLLELRKTFEQEFGTQDVDYYVEPVRAKWKGDEQTIPEQTNSNQLNQILYGPPGTGKTYETINRALLIADAEFYHQNKDQRSKLKERFDQLMENNRIGFVTFHQSFSYEDFVEGLKATTEDKQVSYKIEDGIFKLMCQPVSPARYTDLIEVSESFGSFVVEEITDELIIFCKKNGNRLPIAREIIDEFCRAYEDEKFDINVEQKYWLKSFENRLEPYFITGFDTLYRVMLPALLERSKVASVVDNRARSEFSVLIIDEINRGNISNIFGELITLIEPSKRAGGKEALSVKLPYSKEPFSVPSNLHIIGTMNTADKSLAQLDIALRRRFEFVEMMTNYKLLAEIPEIEGIDVCELVKTMNKRIELLYDREHTIGHSFFLPLRENPSINLLAEIFELQILPLLEEYFFEDWERVAQVLGDHLKTRNELRFVLEQFNADEISALMGEDWDMPGIQPYCRNNDALKNPEAYIGIYA